MRPDPAASTRAAGVLGWSALAGVAAGGLTVAVAEFLAALLDRSGQAGGTPSPVLALGGAFIDRTPPWLKDFAIATFGTHDKQALLTGIALVVLAGAAGAGVLAARRRHAGSAAVIALAAVAAAAVLSRPGATALDLLPVLLGAAVGLVALGALIDRRRRVDDPGRSPVHRAMARRSFLGALAGAGAVAAVGGAGASVLAGGARAVRASRQVLRLPRPAPGAGPTAAELTGLPVPGVSALVTPVEQFYRIDTALAVPQVAPADWRLRIHGMVANEVEINFAELLALPMVERMITLSCVSNEVGGDLVGNQLWLGHPVRELLARARPASGADMVLSASADGWTAGTPLAALTDPKRDALLAVGMSGAPLPVEHGFPARLVVPGLYGYVSATKWVIDLEVTRFDRAQGYWTPRGWAPLGPIKTESRIDVPRAGQQIRAGRVAVAGVAWAPHLGIDGVEVRVDDGPWSPARLGTGGTLDSWRQWVWAWDATPGKHTLAVRATDGSGAVQTAERAEPAPDGASGWHAVEVTVA
jgi:DMSO/TMAO reductase YedYZ molybdopterin-dependent catalytic subunit